MLSVPLLCVSECAVLLLRALSFCSSLPESVSVIVSCGRVKLKDGVAFLGARASDPVVWTVSQDVRSDGHRVVTLHCRRKDNGFSQRYVRLHQHLNRPAVEPRYE